MRLFIGKNMKKSVILIVLCMILLICMFHQWFAKSFFPLSKSLFQGNKAQHLLLRLMSIGYTTPFRLVKRSLPTSSVNRKVIKIIHTRGSTRGDFGNFPIVPNYVHYIRLNESTFTFVEAMCLLSAFRNHVPNKIIIHTHNSNLSGVLWDNIKATRGLRLILQTLPLDIPKDISGRTNDSKIVRTYIKLQILKKYGGIVLDNDIFVIRNLDKYLNYEMVIHWKGQESLPSDRALIASTDARLLRVWLSGYKKYLRNTNIKVNIMNPLQYALYKCLSKRLYEAHVDRRFLKLENINMDLIYEEIWGGWHNYDVLCLRMDSVTGMIRKKISSYFERFETDRDTKSYDDVNSYITFMQLIYDVYH